MEFNSKIATTKEQSERLLALGLKPGTADMVYHYTKSRVKALEWELKPQPPTLRGKFWTPERIAKLSSPFHKHADGTPMTGEEIFDELWGKDIPAWSLSRLWELLPVEVPDPKPEFQPHHPVLIKDKPGHVVSIRRHTADCLVGTYRESNPIECCVSIIDWLIKNKHFNKEYIKIDRED